jgi:YhcH/YjgK/YiaL family protein
MIYDKIENLDKYPELARVKEFLDKHRGKILENGKYIIDKNCYVLALEYETGAGDNFESHRKYIDVQMLVGGREYILVQDVKKGKVLTEYNEEKDILFYSVEDFTAYLLDENNFLMLDKEDLHKPCVAINEPMLVKKYVFKIQIED